LCCGSVPGGKEKRKKDKGQSVFVSI